MQQLIITLVALLGMIVPVANSRMTKLFMRIMPPMTNTGRVAVEAQDGTMSGQPQGRTELAHALSWLSPPKRQFLRHQVSQLRQPQPGWRSDPGHPMTALATQQGLFFGSNDIGRGDLGPKSIGSKPTNGHRLSFASNDMCFWDVGRLSHGPASPTGEIPSNDEWRAKPTTSVTVAVVSSASNPPR